jgi:hypothetical protein
MKLTAYQDRIRHLLDQHSPLSPEDRAHLDALYKLQPSGESPLSPPTTPARHPGGCGCVECWNMGLEVGEYLHRKKLFNDNGFG